jgi:hypothetical protein
MKYKDTDILEDLMYLSEGVFAVVVCKNEEKK